MSLDTVGQRCVSEREPELGLGIVAEIDRARVTVDGPADGVRPNFVSFREFRSEARRGSDSAGKRSGIDAVPRLLTRDFPSRRFRTPLCLVGCGSKPGSWRKWPCARAYDPAAASVKSLIRCDANFLQIGGGGRRRAERKTSCFDSFTELAGVRSRRRF